MVMVEDIKKITINKNETSTKRKSQMKSQVKKLAEDPNKVREYVQEKMNNIKQDGLKSWLFPRVHTNTNIDIEQVINDIKDKKIPHKYEKQVTHIPSQKKKNKKEVDNTPKINNTSIFGGGIKKKQLISKKDGRIYSKKELKDLVNLLIKLNKSHESKKINKVLKKLTRNQCNQILIYRKLIRKSWSNAPLPLLRFIVYQTISCSKIKYIL